ncbi:MAG: hypothetical protein JSV86_17870 [Gemmatimonadota bacterium]|nr:MAG: hypothetical protein JSV86_17870 [Gemmatimonadota bacterium]
MKRLLLTVGLASLVLVPSTAQGQIYVGAEGGWGDDLDWYLGGRLTADLTPQFRPVAIIGSFNYFWPEETLLREFDYWEVNINAAFMQRVYGRAADYAAAYFGLGLNIADITITTKSTGDQVSDTEYGMNVIGGTKYKLGRVTPFFEIGFTIWGSEQIRLTGGLDLALGEGF